MTTPGAPESRFVEAHDGLRLHYLDWGNEGATPLLLLHGLQDSAALWGTFATGMRDDYHVVALDHRGHGDSPHAEDYPIADYVGEVAAAVRALELRDVVLIGHSAGSKNAWMCIAENPGIAAKLVITDMDPDSYNPGSVTMISRYKDEGDEYDDMPAVIERLRSRQPNATDEMNRASADALITTTADGKLTWKRDRGVVTKYERPDAWDTLPRVGVPTLIARGADSPLLRHDVAVRMQAAIPDCKLAEIPGGGHWMHLEQPDAYLSVVREFLLPGA
jgi:pimeloyl-ACP methyl ester carboxylesterase